MKKALIAGAASVALAAMPVLGVFATPDFSDNISVEVDASCSFTNGGTGGSYSYADGTNTSGQVAPVNSSSSAAHEFTVFCNNNSGYTVTAETDALAAPNISEKFVYVASLPNTGTTAAWHATVATESSTLQISQLGAPAQGETSTSGTIASLSTASGANGEAFTVTYSAYIGTATPAGTYTGTIGYTLAAN